MDVFISYSTKDQEAAQGIMRMLEENHITYWICRSKIIAGDRWASEIVEALDSCKAVLLIVSKNSLASDQVPKEINFALEKQLPIIPYKIDNSPMKGELAYHLANIHRIQSEPFNNRYDELLEAISCKTGKKGTGGYVNASNSYNNITANVTNNISLNRISNFSIKWLLVVIAVIILLAAVIAGFNKDKDNDEAADSAVQGTVQQTVNEPLPDKSTDNTADASQPEQDKQENSGSAVFPDDIEPYQTSENQNFYSIYRNEPDRSFCISGEEYSTGLTAVGKGAPFFLFNISDKGYTNLSFKSGHVDGTDNDVQYILVYADNEEIYRTAVNPDELASVSDINIAGVNQIRIEIVSPDADFVSSAQTGIADIIFYNSAEYTPDGKAPTAVSSHEKAPEDIMPYQTGSNINGYKIYNNSLNEDDFFTMAGNEYRSGFTADGQLDGMFLFNVSDKGYTNMSFLCGHIDGTDMLRQYVVVYGNGEEIFRKEIDPEALPEKVDVPIEGVGNIKLDFEYESDSIISRTSAGITELVFYNSSEYKP